LAHLAQKFDAPRTQECAIGQTFCTICTKSPTFIILAMTGLIYI